MGRLLFSLYKTGKINFLLTKEKTFDNVSASDTNTSGTEEENI